jgi:hypothetical protein
MNQKDELGRHTVRELGEIEISISPSFLHGSMGTTSQVFWSTTVLPGFPASDHKPVFESPSNIDLSEPNLFHQPHLVITAQRSRMVTY